MAGGAAEAQAGGQDARAAEDTLLDAVADWDAEAADSADGGEAVGEAVVGLLDGDGLLLEQRLHDPVGVVVGKVAGEVQVGVDEAGHDGLAGGVDDLVALRQVLHGAGVPIGAVLPHQHERVVDRHRPGAVDKLATDDCVPASHGVPLRQAAAPAKRRIARYPLLRFPKTRSEPYHLFLEAFSAHRACGRALAPAAEYSRRAIV